MMKELEKSNPAYGFEPNIWDMAQRQHLEAIEAHGVLEEHRKSHCVN